MTDADALLAAALASPDDHSLKLVWLDAYQERHGETPWVRACRDFLAKCGERRKYETKDRMVHAVGAFGHVVKNARRALPGWRDWLGGGSAWQDTQSRHVGSWVSAGLMPGNWWLLCPSLSRLITREASWRRKSATVELWSRPNPQPPHYERVEHSARLTFARGFLERAEFRTWESADALLPAILADQPFVECGIRGAVGDYEGYVAISEANIGPAFESLTALAVIENRPAIVNFGRQAVAVFRPGPKNDAPARARRALSDALRKRALAGVGAPALEVAR